MKTALILLLLLCTKGSWAAELLERWPDSKHEWRIVEQATSKDGKTQTVVIAVPGGIFPAGLWLQDEKIDKLTLQLQNIRLAEGVIFQPLKGKPQNKAIHWRHEDLEPRETDLKTVPGFQAQARDKDYELEFTGQALELLRRGGRFQFIDAYR